MIEPRLHFSEMEDPKLEINGSFRTIHSFTIIINISPITHQGAWSDNI